MSRTKVGTRASRGAVGAWLVEAGLETADATELVRRLAERLCAEGVSLARLWVGADILHPTIGARTVSWSSRHGVEAAGFSRSERRDLDSPAWRATPLRVLLGERLREIRRRLDALYEPGEFALLDRLRAEGMTDYLACAVYYPPATMPGERSGMVATFTSDAPGGFTAAELGLLRSVVPPLALVWRSIMLHDAARAVTTTYLGADAAARVLAGRIARGEVETIRAAIWFSDLEGFTSLADTLPKGRLMALLNVYAGTVLDTIAKHGGQVLKLMGDGVLATFPLDAGSGSCRRALDAAIDGLGSIEKLSAERRSAGEPTTRLFVGLHLGEVLYGNVGSDDRLDFTVVGPAVNEASRLERMCRTLGRPAVASAAFAAACHDPGRLRRLGLFSLRGVARQQELFALEADGCGRPLSG